MDPLSFTILYRVIECRLTKLKVFVSRKMRWFYNGKSLKVLQKRGSCKRCTNELFGP